MTTLRNKATHRLTVILIAIITGTIFFLSSSLHAAPSIAASSADALLQGERMYRDGILPSGQPLQAVVKGDIQVPGTAFTCVSCHLRSGLGSYEGGVTTPATSGEVLYNPLDLKYRSVKVENKFYPITFTRPAYNDVSLATALREGIDPNGSVMNPVMPRYFLNDAEMALMINYLKTLSSAPPPGATESTLHFATILSEDVAPELSEAFLYSLENFVRFKNNMADYYTKNPRGARMAASMLRQSKVEYKKLSLSKWILKGAPETWKTQLEEYYSKDPVFGILGGITNRDWQPVHEFSETSRIPTLFPITDFPVISEKDWYTLYLSKGVYQEGESAANYLNSLDAVKGKPIVQIVRNSPKGLRIAKGFDNTWNELGHPYVITVSLNQGEHLTQEKIKQLISEHHPAALLVWDDADAVPAINSLTSIENLPEHIILSSSYIGKNITSLNDAIRDRIYIMLPFSLPQDEAVKKISLNHLTGSRVFSGEAELVVKKVYSITNILSLALMDMRGNYYRDNMLDAIGMQADQPAPASGMQANQPTPLYERLSFGPGQRYASKGCYVTQLTKGHNPQFIKKSDWVIH